MPARVGALHAAQEYSQSNRRPSTTAPAAFSAPANRPRAVLLHLPALGRRYPSCSCITASRSRSAHRRGMRLASSRRPAPAPGGGMPLHGCRALLLFAAVVTLAAVVPVAAAAAGDPKPVCQPGDLGVSVAGDCTATLCAARLAAQERGIELGAEPTTYQGGCLGRERLTERCDLQPMGDCLVAGARQAAASCTRCPNSYLLPPSSDPRFHRCCRLWWAVLQVLNSGQGQLRGRASTQPSRHGAA